MTGQRQRAERRGRRGERLARIFLTLKGYRILGERVRTPVGEIDLIAARGRLIAFIEVKAHKHLEAALGAVTPASRTRIARAASLWVGQTPSAQDKDWRFDVILVRPPLTLRHIRDAWRPDFALTGL